MNVIQRDFEREIFDIELLLKDRKLLTEETSSVSLFNLLYVYLPTSYLTWKAQGGFFPEEIIISERTMKDFAGRPMKSPVTQTLAEKFAEMDKLLLEKTGMGALSARDAYIASFKKHCQDHTGIDDTFSDSDTTSLNLNLINHEQAERKLSGDQENAWAKLKVWVYNDKPFFVLRGFAGTGKCREGSAVLSTNKGLQTLKELFRDQGIKLKKSGETEVETKVKLAVATPTGFNSVEGFYSKRVLETLRVVSNGAPRLRGTANHPVVVLSEKGPIDKTLEELEPGDVLVGKLNSKWLGSSLNLLCSNSEILAATRQDDYQRVTKSTSTPKILTKELARLLGYLVADGHISKTGFKLSTGNKQVYKDVIFCLQECFPNFKFRIPKGEKLPLVAVGSKYLRYWIHMACGFSKNNGVCVAKDKQIPEIIRLAPKEMVLQFLSAYLSCDSEFTKDTLNLCSASEELMRQMVMLLTHFGAYPAKVKSGLHKAHNKNSSGIYRRYFNVSYSSFSINSLIQKLDIKKSIKTWKLSQDQRRLPKICLEAWIKILSSFQTIKNKVFAKLPDGTLFACQKSDLKKGLATSRGNLRKDRQYLTRRALLGVNWYLAAKINPEATKLILYCLKEDTWFSTVTKIKRIKKASRVYDVCVPEGNYFIADGLINHNTFLMQLMSELKLRMYFSAPTNKAAKVLGVSVKSVAKTIYSLLGLRMEQVEDKLVLSEGRDHPYFPAGAIIVIDEASMLNEQLCTILKKVQLKHRIKILVVGDPIQIPPVGEAKTLAWKFTQDQECRAVLKEQMRFDNQILALSTRLRECIKNKDWTSPIRSDHSESEGVWKYRTEEQFERSILKVINTSEDCLQNKVMAWRNKTVNYYNKLIRRHLGFKGDYCVGDIILLAEPIEDDDGNLIAHTDDEFTITGIDHSEITVDQENVPVWVLQVQGDKSYILNVPEDPDTLARILSQKAMFAKKQKDQFRAAAWKNFWKTKKTFNAVRYGYALTAHRGQGSTYTNVWVDQLDILSNPNKREAFSCLYVACTRPTTILSSF